MILSIPFLAFDLKQFDPDWIKLGYGIEASIFNRNHILDKHLWSMAKKNIAQLAEQYDMHSFVFHFPVNDCNYLDDNAIRDRLFESIDMVEEYKLDGMVLHSNLIDSTSNWMSMNVEKERLRYLDFVESLRSRTEGNRSWIGIENMPIQGNDALELDPVLVFPQDFKGIAGGQIGITWDFCHYSYSVYAANAFLNNELDEHIYPNIRECDFLDFSEIMNDIVHIHFSAFNGLASIKNKTLCTEGVLPWQASVEEKNYKEAFQLISRQTRAKAATLEIREDDYTDRINIFKAISWCSENVDTRTK